MKTDVGKEFLEHFGVKGMRWGVRRKSAASKKGSKTSYQKGPGRLSEEELKRRIGRMELERKYSDLNLGAKAPGKAYANSIMQNTGRSIVGGVAGTVVTFMVQRALKKKFG